MVNHPNRSLSYRQRQTLDEVRRAMPQGLRRGCTNQTLTALEKKGLVRLEFVDSEHVAGVRVERWYLVEG